MEGGVLFNKDLLCYIFKFTSPWDRSQNIPLVCKKWAGIQYKRLGYIKRRMAWLIWKNVLQDGPLNGMMRKALPFPCATRNYGKHVKEHTNKIFSDAFPHATIFDKFMVPTSSDRHIVEIIWKRLFVNCFSKNIYLSIKPLYEIYLELIDLLDQRYGIVNVDLSKQVKYELRTGPEREQKRREGRKRFMEIIGGSK